MELLEKSWKCTCSTENPLRIRKCRKCGRIMPAEIREGVYSRQLVFLRESLENKEIENSKKRCDKVMPAIFLFTKLMPLVAVIMVMAYVGLRYQIIANVSEDEVLRDILAKREFLLMISNCLDNRFAGPKALFMRVAEILNSYEVMRYPDSVVLELGYKGKYIVISKVEIVVNKICEVFEYVNG